MGKLDTKTFHEERNENAMPDLPDVCIYPPRPLPCFVRANSFLGCVWSIILLLLMMMMPPGLGRQLAVSS